ncbi:hypothetical protein [Bartonella sp. HY761]|uniref:hypothetical protein n=1 Tax=Bartonella sp. HY761 TaxID=2979330 RepID=UPI0021FE306F|nr:hypothetical protein [Bartonella sp. HY761]UXN06928.1 hypothetical protein N6A79_02650 [Bartonella sp. HY761]
MYKLIFSTADINEKVEEYTYLFNLKIYLNLYYANNYFSKIMFRDVYKENNYYSEDLGGNSGLDIWITQCSLYNGPMALKDVQEIHLNRCDNRFAVNIKSASDKIDLQCWRLEIYQHNQDRITFFPSIDKDRLPIFDRKGQDTIN